MTESERIRRAFLRAVAEAKKTSPYDTGNLRKQGVKQMIGRELKIYVDTKIAPYMKYTNEPWNNFSPPLKGKQNPNEGWWGRAAEAVAYSMAHDLKGKIQ